MKLLPLTSGGWLLLTYDHALICLDADFKERWRSSETAKDIRMSSADSPVVFALDGDPQQQSSPRKITIRSYDLDGNLLGSLVDQDAIDGFAMASADGAFFGDSQELSFVSIDCRKVWSVPLPEDSSLTFSQSQPVSAFMTVGDRISTFGTDGEQQMLPAVLPNEYRGIVALESILLCLKEDQSLLALDFEGHKLWETGAGVEYSLYQGYCELDGQLLVADEEEKLNLIDASGQRRWTTNLKCFEALGSEDGQTVYMMSARTGVLPDLVFDLSPSLSWSRWRLRSINQAGKVRWSFLYGDCGQLSELVLGIDSRVYFIAEDSNLYAFEP